MVLSKRAWILLLRVQVLNILPLLDFNYDTGNNWELFRSVGRLFQAKILIKFYHRLKYPFDTKLNFVTRIIQILQFILTAKTKLNTNKIVFIILIPHVLILTVLHPN